MKRIALFSFLLLCFIVLLNALMGHFQSQSTRERLHSQAEEALVYCKQNNLSTDYCFLADFDIHSGKERFFVWDFKKDRVVYSTICAHGCGGNSTLIKADFSNKPGSNCSSIGHYRVGKSRTMNNNKNIPCLELDGLDLTCNNARYRGILIHPSVAQFPTWPVPILHNTKGCFGLSWKGFKTIERYKNQTSQPILLLAYDSGLSEDISQITSMYIAKWKQYSKSYYLLSLDYL